MLRSSWRMRKKEEKKIGRYLCACVLSLCVDELSMWHMYTWIHRWRNCQLSVMCGVELNTHVHAFNPFFCHKVVLLCVMRCDVVRCGVVLCDVMHWLKHRTELKGTFISCHTIAGNLSPQHNESLLWHSSSSPYFHLPKEPRIMSHSIDSGVAVEDLEWLLVD